MCSWTAATMSGLRGGRRFEQEWKYDPNHPANLNIAPSWSRAGRQPQGGPELVQQDHATVSSTSKLVAEDRWQQDSAEDIEQWGIAGRIWEAAYLFKLYLCPPQDSIEFDPTCPLFANFGEPNGSDDVTALHVLELGSGAGYVGLSCARELDMYRRTEQASGSQTRRKARLVLTDLDNVVPLMTRNARMAGFSDPSSEDTPTQAAAPGSSSLDVLVRPLPWGSASHAASILQKDLSRIGEDQGRPPLDFVLCSDLVYFPHLLPPLLRSLLDLTQTSLASPSAATSPSSASSEFAAYPGPTVLMAYKIRSYAKEEAFWSALGVWFDVEIVSCRYTRPLSCSLSQTKEDLSGQNQEKEERRREGVWHRFGSFKADLNGPQAAPSDAEDGSWEEEQESSDDAYFLFVARRKPSTLAYQAPKDDDKLMDGFMALSHACDEVAAAVGQEELVRGQGGADFIEWALMGSMDMT